MKTHAEKGYEILRGSRSRLLDLAALIAWTHHEKSTAAVIRAA
jgi:response regulator RpfG family c-di-GMP phosphodiesterase